MSKNTVRITYSGDARGLHRATSEAEGHLRRLNSTSRHVFGGIGKAAGLAAGVGGLLGFGFAAKAAFQEYADQARVAAQTNAVLKSTGAAANVTAKHVDRLAASISNYSGMDDEAVQAGENMLLTFTQIQNRVGKHNDIFDQATKATADLSVAMGIDMPKAALQVGKALNDPERGMSRLQRIGVAFTDDQKKLVKHLMATGHTADAQKVILAELTKEFGGSAKAAGETLPGKLKILQENLRNMGAELVVGLVPALSKGVSWLTKMLPTFREWGTSLTATVGPAVGKVAGVISDAFPKIRQLIGSFVAWFKANLMPIFRDLWAIVVTTFRRIAAVVESHRAELTKLFQNIGTILKNLWAVAGPILKILFQEVLPRVIGIAIVALSKISTVIAGVSKIFRASVAFILTAVDKFLGGLQALAEGLSHLPFVGDKFRGVADAIGRARDHVRELRDEIKKTHGKNVAVNVKLSATGFSAQRPGDGLVYSGEGSVGSWWNGVIGRMAASALTAGTLMFPGALGGGSASAAGLRPYIRDDLARGQAMGLRLTSGVRPGAITSTGNVSLHATGEAIDMSGNPALMAAYAASEAGRSGIAEVIYTGPGGKGGWYPGVGWTWKIPTSIIRDHRAHVHVGATSGDGLVGDGMRRRRGRPGGYRLGARPRRPTGEHWGELTPRLELAIFDAEDTPGTEDDVLAHQAALAFFEAQLRWAKRYKLGAAVELKIKRAIRDQKDALHGAQGGSEDLQAQLDQANRRLQVSQTALGLDEAFIATGGVGGGRGGRRAGGGGGGGEGHTFVFPMLIPDAEQMRRATSAIAQGAGTQPHRTATRESLGL